jgi:hypothetical protein
MGLLDDAIREHLELKRLKGADPQEIARDERDALGRASAAADRSELSDALQPPASSGVTHRAASAAAVHGRGQETVELDMDAALADERESFAPAGEHGGQAADDQDQVPQGTPDTQDSLEREAPWQMRDGDDPNSEEPIEDVLEETPDFLRGTPEQERLWFEQRPPRDFDFNE